MPQLKPLRGLQLNRSHPLARGLAACWVMNENIGNKVYDPISVNSGKFYGGTAWRAGGLYFATANTDYVLLDKSLAQSTSGNRNWAVVFRAKQNVVGVYGKLCGNNDNTQFIWLRGDVPQIIWSGGQQTTFSYTGNYALFHQYIIRPADTGVNLELYVDGILVSSATNYQNFTFNFTRFGTPASSYGLVGNLDYFFFYNRAIPATEILRLYREPFAIFERPNTGRIGFYQAVGATLLDFERNRVLPRGLVRGIA